MCGSTTSRHYVETVTAPGFDHPIFAARGPFDLIVANILARSADASSRRKWRSTSRRAARSILSGILDRQRDAVIAAYVGQNFRHVRTLQREGWVTHPPQALTRGWARRRDCQAGRGARLLWRHARPCRT